MKKLNSLSYFIAGCLFFWAVLFIAQIFKPYNPDTISNFAAQCEFVIQFFTLIAVILVYRKINSPNRKIWAWLIVMSVGLFLTDLTFYTAVYR